MLNRSIRYASNFPIVPKTDSASFNEQVDFSGSSLQATYGHLLIQASYRQFDQFSKQQSRQTQQALTSYSIFQEAVYRPPTAIWWFKRATDNLMNFPNSGQDRLSDYRLFRANYGTIYASCSAAKLVRYCFLVLYISVQRTTV